LGKLIDAGLDDTHDRCHFDIETGAIIAKSGTEKRGNNKLTLWTRQRMEQYWSTHHSSSSNNNKKHSKRPAQPELYCYYGVEGNPVFTDRLVALEHRVMAQLRPRLVRSVYYFTETVASGGGDGPMTLYLDTVNKDHNYFGSSLLSTHTDVRISIKAGDGTLTGVPVTGRTLSTLLQKTLLHQAGAHVLIKIDIAGAEYALLNAAKACLCDTVAHGVRVDVRVEIHPKKTLGGTNHTDLELFKNTVRFQLKDCGVNLDVAGDAG
jgi:hypothetical protein